MVGPLSGVKVLDLTHWVAGPYCTKLLADYGSEVIKIEKPGEGDATRRLGPFLQDEPHPEKSGMFLHLNTNKKGITLNLKTTMGIRIIKQLVQWADILVENFEPRVMPSLGLNYQTLRTINPNLVMTSISNFGQTGPYSDFKASEITLYAMGGAMNATGVPEQPLKLAGFVAQYQAGTVAAVATMGAFIGAAVSGVGQHVDVSIMEVHSCGADRRAQNLLSYGYSGATSFFRSHRLGLFIMPHGRYPCKDGFVEYAGAGPIFWPRWARMLSMPELLEDPMFSDLTDLGHKDEFEAIFLPWLSELSKKEAEEKAQREGIPAAAVQTPGEVVRDIHLNTRGFFVRVNHPETGQVIYPGAPFKMSKTPWEVRSSAPILGQHNNAVFCDLLGYNRSDIVRLREAGII